MGGDAAFSNGEIFLTPVPALTGVDLDFLFSEDAVPVAEGQNVFQLVSETRQFSGHFGPPFLHVGPEPDIVGSGRGWTSASDEIIVYVTRTGEKYHRESCSYLRQSKIETTLSEAIEDGYTPCSRCHPPTE